MEVKRGQNRGLSTPPCLPLACLQARLNHEITNKRVKPLAALLRQGINNQSVEPTYESKVAKSKCRMPTKVHVLPTMNSLPPNATCRTPQY